MSKSHFMTGLRLIALTAMLLLVAAGAGSARADEGTPTAPNAADTVAPGDVSRGNGVPAPAPLLNVPPPPSACANTIWASETFVTGVGNGSGGADTSAVTAPDTAFGENENFTAGVRLADDFVVSSSATPSEIVLYGYQTGSTTTSTFTSIRGLRLWNGVPGAGGTVIAGPFDVTSGFTTAWTNVYRVASTALTGNTRPVMYVRFNWPFTSTTTLSPGTYWLEWSMTGSLASGPFIPPHLQLAGDNALKSIDNGATWAASVDGGSARNLDFPFVICGSSGPTSTPSNTPIVSNTPTNTPTATATSTPTNTPIPAGALVQDGGFEAGFVPTFWNQTSTTFGTPLCDLASCGGVGPRTGTYWAWFGGTNSAETGTLSQTGTISSGPKTLTFYVWWSSPVVSPPDPAAVFNVKIDGNTIFTLTPATAAAYNTGYTLASVDITAYADNGAHTLFFEGINAASAAATNIHLDDINIITGGPTSTVTNTATATSTVVATSTSTATNTATATNTPVPLLPDTIGVYNTGVFYLRNTNNTGVADITAFFGGDPSDLPVVGDWNGDGVDTIGVYRNSTGFYFLSDSNTSPAVNYTVLFGNPGDTPFAGRWDNTMTGSGLGVYRNSNGILYQKKQLTTGFDDFFAIYGNPGDVGFAGDWNANGFDSIGVYRSSNLTWFLSNNSTPSGITFSDIDFILDTAGATPVVGDWDGDGDSTPGWLTTGGVFSLHPNNSIVGPDNVFAFGPVSSKPIAGKWVASARPATGNLLAGASRNTGSNVIEGSGD